MTNRLVWVFFFQVLIIVSAFLTGCPSETAYELAYEQVPPTENGFASVLWGYDYMLRYQAADPFVLAAGRTTIGRIDWWGDYDPESPEQYRFIVRIFEDNGSGQPRSFPRYAIPAGSGSPEATSLDGVYAFTTEFTPVELNPAVTYYLSIVNEQAYEWLWALIDNASATTLYYYRQGESGTWTATPVVETFAVRLWGPAS